MAIGTADIRRLRLRHQHIVEPYLEGPEEVVSWMGAVQAQDYAQAAWALGLRARNIVVDDIDRALAEGTILRTHVMRPTWHFVSPQDIRWLLALTSPRIKAGLAHRYRELQLDERVFAETNDRLARALEGGRYLTREELGRVLEGAGVETRSQRLPHILTRAELDGVICSGPKRGKQFTYALLDERAPSGRNMDREEAVVELVRRYFAGHGPATVWDFAWWSGLTITDARAGLAALGGQFECVRVEDREYWVPHHISPLQADMPAVHLLPAFDEYTVAFADRRDALLPEHSPQNSQVMLGPVVVRDGYVIGSWRRAFTKGHVAIEARPFTPERGVDGPGVASAAARYGEFLGMPAVLS